MDTYEFRVQWPAPHTADSSFTINFQQKLVNEVNGQSVESWITVPVVVQHAFTAAQFGSAVQTSYFNVYYGSNNQNALLAERFIYKNAQFSVPAATDD